MCGKASERVAPRQLPFCKAWSHVGSRGDTSMAHCVALRPVVTNKKANEWCNFVMRILFSIYIFLATNTENGLNVSGSPVSDGEL
ncbi:hypothetical protein AAFF_G00296850 [Aldrovandia affinis]|uniref:Uncharacterized protein n=1 Tax=Aldrovandia affinis TaxID=143900 RepID=A0AAD7WSI8_9TELE|nr:hypothetical protein AAFF_G00296850 [Aldrovandia affinis]